MMIWLNYSFYLLNNPDAGDMMVGTDLIEKWTKNGLCKYVNDKKISEWQLATGVQFPVAVLHSDNQNIKTYSDFVNSQKANLSNKEKNQLKEAISILKKETVKNWSKENE